MLWEGKSLTQNRGLFSFKLPTVSSSKHDLSLRQWQTEEISLGLLILLSQLSGAPGTWILRKLSDHKSLFLKNRGKPTPQSLGLGLKPLRLPKGEIDNGQAREIRKLKKESKNGSTYKLKIKAPQP